MMASHDPNRTFLQIDEVDDSLPISRRCKSWRRGRNKEWGQNGYKPSKQRGFESAGRWSHDLGHVQTRKWTQIDGKRKVRIWDGIAAAKTDWGHSEDGHVVFPTTSHIRERPTALEGHVHMPTIGPGWGLEEGSCGAPGWNFRTRELSPPQCTDLPRFPK